MERLVQLRVLAAAVALGEFTVAELAAYSGANLNTVSSVVHRNDGRFFARVPRGQGEHEVDEVATEAGPVGTGARARGRPATRWRVTEPGDIRRLVTDLQTNLSDAERAAARPRQGTDDATFLARLAAVEVAGGALLQICEERDPELRRVLARTALDNLAVAGPSPASDRGPEGKDWWDAVPLDPSRQGAPDEVALRRRAGSIATLSRLIDAEARGAILGSGQLARAMIAFAGLDPAPEEAQIQAFIERVTESALKTRRKIREANVLGSIVKASSPVSVDKVVADTRLTQDAVEHSVQRLLERNYVVRQYEGEGPEHGRRLAVLRVNQDQHRAIGVSILPGKVVGVLTDLKGNGSSLISREFGTTSGSRVDVDKLVGEVASLVRELAQGRDDIIGLGVELPGHVGHEGQVIYSPILRQANVQLEERLQRATRLRTVVENDANALATYEQYFGDGTELRDFAVVLLPERGGVGSGLISNSRVLKGTKGAAGELGHIQFKPDGELCDCGKRGCLETVAGVAGILREVRRLRRSVSRLTDAAELAAEDKAVQKVFETAGKALGWGITTVLNLLDPEKVILFAPAELVGQQPAARRFMGAVHKTARDLAFSTTAEVTPVARKLPHEPVWRPLPQETKIAARAASAVLGHFMPRAHEWTSDPGEPRALVGLGSGVHRPLPPAAHEA